MPSYLEYPYPTDDGSSAHPYLVPALLSLLGKPNGSRVLDVGCGNGYVARQLLQSGYDVMGLDASTEGIERAKAFYPDRFFLHEVGRPDLPRGFPTEPFDILISLEVIEHVYDPRGFVGFCRRALKPGGTLILSTPYHSYFKNLVLAVTGKMDAHFTALWDSGHIKFWSRRTLTRLLSEKGFAVTDFKGAGRVPYLWKTMLIAARLSEDSRPAQSRSARPQIREQAPSR
jgi:2-polyprenyl-3-methyl-5-hydroxy-6-metoxy-1,4-benzoquinol methylase